MGILDQIVEHKREELATRRRQMPLADVRRRAADAPPARPFHAALRGPGASGGRARGVAAGAGVPRVRLIAEVKGASPSAGIIRAEFDPAAVARAYAAAGASAVSVLTDARFFHGADEHLRRVRAAADLPVLRKDFTLDPYHVYEARAIGADAVLLIAAILDRGALADLAALAGELGMATLIEAHTSAELETALAVPGAGAGRDAAGRPLVPPDVTVVSESGIESRRDVEEMERLGVHAVLIGTALMRPGDPGARVRELFGAAAPQGD